MIYNLAVDFFDIGSAIAHAFRTLFGLIAVIIYDLIIVIYDLFEYLARAEILHNEVIMEIYRKAGFLLGLFMIFKLIFSLIQSLIEPSKLDDKKHGYTSVLTRSIISIILLGLTPTIFKEAFKLQNLIIGSNDNSENILYKLIVSDSNIPSTGSFGRIVSTELYFSFYRDDVYPKLKPEVDTEAEDFEFYDSKIEEIKSKIRTGTVKDGSIKYENFSSANEFLNDKADGEYVVEYNELLSVLVGAAVLYILVIYCIQTAARVFQLAFLQLMAPIPILSYISDPEGNFKKWINQCISTFLDLFIRLAIIYFVIYFSSYLITLFEDKNSVLINSTGIDPDNLWMLTLLEVFLLVGLFVFGQKVPELFKELLPQFGGAGRFSFGLNPKKELIEPFKKAYKSSPIGWTAKGMGWAGKKALGYVDRKMHGGPKPRGKFGQYIDKLMPERAKDIAASRQAKIDEKLREKRDVRGKSIFDSCTYIDKEGNRKFDPNKAFIGTGAEDYINSYNSVKNAKKAMKEAETLVSDIDKELTAAYTISDKKEREKAIELAKIRREAAVKNYGAYEAKYKLEQEKHDSMKKQARYAKFSEIEDDYKYYTDRYPEFIDIPESSSKTIGYSQSKFSQSDSPNVTSSGISEIVIPEVSPKESSRFEEEKKQQFHEKVQQEIVETSTQVSKAINNNTNLDETKKKTAETLQQRLTELISYKEQIRDQKDKSEIEQDIQRVKAELDKLLK